MMNVNADKPFNNKTKQPDNALEKLKQITQGDKAVEAEMAKVIKQYLDTKK